MIDARWERIKELLHQALQLTEDQRRPFLEQACGFDDPLRREVESLLAADADARASFLQSVPRPVGLDQGCEGTESCGFLSAGQLFEQRFQLVRVLGEGGMGQVWLAEQTSPVQRQVALKLIRAGMYDQAVVQRFQSERQSLALMDHPAIAKVFDAGATARGQPYFVMEYVPGLSITEYCDLHKLGIGQRLELFIRACDGVQHAHQKAIIHRDLKPDNILVVEIDGVPMPRIIDFGLARPARPRVVDQTLYTQLGQFVGTPGYMSPEQANPAVRDIDTRTDVYSLGVILYVLLTGLQPFETQRRQQVPLDEWLRRLREEDPPRLSAKVSADMGAEAAAARSTEPKQLMRLLRGDLEWICLKALSRERERRYATPSELAADLRRHLDHEPVVARPASAVYQLRKFARRHRLAAVVAGVVGVFAIVASIAGLLAVRKQHEAEHERSVAEYQTQQALQAQSRLLTEVAAGRLKDSDVTGAQRIILAVLTDPRLVQDRSSAAISVFQEIRAADNQLAILSGHRDRVYSSAYSPDGAHIVTASADKTARIWDALTGAELVVLAGHTDRVFCAAYSPDGTRIVTASNDKTARIWDAHTGMQLAVLSGHGDRVASVSYSPDGMRIVTGSWDKTARVWDAHTGLQLLVLTGHGDAVYSAAYSPAANRIVTASQDKTARVWDARKGLQLAVLSGHGDYVASGAYSPDGRHIVTASADKTARVWDSRTGAQVAVLSGHSDVVFSADYSPAGTRIVTASWDKTARIWDAQDGTQLGVLSGHNSTVGFAAYSPDGKHIVTASQDRTARVWDAGVTAQVGELSGHRNVVYSAAYSPDGARIVTASYDKTARIWDARSGEGVVVLSGHGGAVDSAAYSPDGARIVTTSQDETARIWDARTGSQLVVLSGHTDRVYAGAYSPDSTQVITTSRDKTARIWDVHTGTQLVVLSGHRDRVYFGVYSRDGTQIVTASRDKTARIWNSRTGAQLSVLSGHGDEVLTASFSPDGTRVVTASLDGTARIWDAHSGSQLATLSGHASGVTSAGYSPDGKVIVTASADKTARIWDAHTAEQLAVLRGHIGGVESANYSPDGTHIITASEDGTARIWDARLPANLSAQIIWGSSAEIDPLSDIEAAQLGVAADPRVRTWRAEGSACDRAAGALYDPDRVTRGALLEYTRVDAANSACATEISKPDHVARLDYQMGRALLAKGDTNGAQLRLETAVARGYRAARVDLADLLVKPSASPLDLARAVSLYEGAWQSGVQIAAFRLGRVYEQSSRGPPVPTGVANFSDSSKAWLWYRRGAEVGEPNSLARFGEREESNALGETEERKKNSRLLQAMTFYSAAAEHARLEGWPDNAWRQWRHRRASLARVLAKEGLMQQVADSYRVALDNGAALSRVLRRAD